MTTAHEEPEVVVVGVDGSPAAARAAHFARRHVRNAQARLVLCHVVPWSSFSVQTVEDNEQRRGAKAQETREAWAQVVQPLVDAATGEGVEVEGVVRHGHPAETLCELVGERGAAHLVVGRRGHSRVRTLLFGSTPSNLIQIATVPVTVVP